MTPRTDAPGRAGLMLPARSVTTLDTVHHLSAERLLCALPSEYVDLIVTSPPYNLRNSTGGHFSKNSKWAQALIADGYDGHDDNMPHEDYVRWQRRVLTDCLRVLKPTGAVFYNHKWRVQEGLMQDRADILEGFPVRQIIIWKRAGGINFNDTYFVPTYEVVYLICKPDFRLVRGASSYGDVWEIMQELNNPHPAPFPVAFAERCIMSTNAQIILDPFMGSGTTAVAAKKLNRHYIGCDISAKYVQMAEGRLRQPVTLPMFPAMLTA